MNTDMPDSPVPSDDALPTPAGGEGAEPAPPKRRTRARKVGADAATDAPPLPEVNGGEGGDAALPDAAAPVRAPRKPRARKADAADMADATGEPGDLQDKATGAVPGAVEVAGSVAEPSSEASTLTSSAEAPLPAAAAAIFSLADDGVAAAGEAARRSDDEGGTGVGPNGESGDAAEGVRERGRNRRRGRRGGAGGRPEDATDSLDTPEGELQATAVAVTLPIATPDTGELFASLLSGDFDVEEDGAAESADEPEEAGVDKRVLAPDVDAPKLHKVLAQSGIGSRRDMEQAIQDGRVKVNGEPAHTGMRISFGDRITLDDKPVRVRIAPPPPRVIAYHKPVGEVVTLDDPQQRPTVFRKLPRLAQGKWQSVGRLDINTEGLLLFTNSGDLANKLMHPRFGVEREYAVRVLGSLEKEPRAQLLAGVQIDGQTAAFKSIEDGGGEGVNRWYRVVIAEGRNREVRKLFDTVGLTVSRLIRVRYGCVVLPRGLKRGVWVDLSESDTKALRLMTGSAPQRDDGRRDDNRRDSAHPSHGKPPAAPRAGQPAPGDRPPRDRQEQRPPRDRQEAGRPPRDRQDGGRPPRDRQDANRGPGGQPRPPRGPRPNVGDELPRDFREPGDPARIPNPLQQTYDKRAILNDRPVRREDEFEDGPIPNPLQQTYDKRFAQGNPAGFSGPRMGKAGKPSKGGAPRQPDPMQTSVGYLGGDAFTRKMQGQQQGQGSGRGGKRRGR